MTSSCTTSMCLITDIQFVRVRFIYHHFVFVCDHTWIENLSDVFNFLSVETAGRGNRLPSDFCWELQYAPTRLARTFSSATNLEAKIHHIRYLSIRRS